MRTSRSSRRSERGAGGPSASPPVTLRITELAMGGEGVGHVDGMAVFVPQALPGDRVEVSLQRKDRWARGHLLRVLEPSVQRVASDCALHPACGGCPWIELQPSAQLSAKAHVLRTTLEHVGHLSLADVDVRAPAAAPAQLRYRHRARLHAERAGDGRVLGFLPMRGRGVIPVEQCGVLELPLERALTSVAAVLRRAPPGPMDVQLSCEPQERGGRVGVCLDIKGAPDRGRWLRTLHALHDAGIPAVEIQRNGQTVVASRSLQLGWAVAPGADGGPFFHDASCFTQGNRAQNDTLTRLVLDGLALKGGEHVLELHSGSGNFSMPVAARAGRVTAVESHPRAVEWARTNARHARHGDRIHVTEGDADDVRRVSSSCGGVRVDALLLDPPRTGAPGLPAVVERVRPARIVYVSCNPATLARDLSRVVPLGYRPVSVQAVDLFPRTWHVEAVVVLEAA